MPQVLIIALAAITFYVALRWVRREYERVELAIKRTEGSARRGSDRRTLSMTLDPTTGTYRLPD